jgi:hypothetical protein
MSAPFRPAKPYALRGASTASGAGSARAGEGVVEATEGAGGRGHAGGGSEGSPRVLLGEHPAVVGGAGNAGADGGHVPGGDLRVEDDPVSLAGGVAEARVPAEGWG